MVPGRAAKESIEWTNKRPKSWRDAIKFGTMDLSGPYSKVFDEALPYVRKVADPFHVVKVRHEAPCVPAVMKGHRLWDVTAS